MRALVRSALALAALGMAALGCSNSGDPSPPGDGSKEGTVGSGPEVTLRVPGMS